MSEMSNGVVNGALLSDRSASYGLSKCIPMTSTVSLSFSKPFTVSGEVSRGKNGGVWRVAACTLTACLASLVMGMVLGFTSPALEQLQHDVPSELQISDDDIKFSLFGVSVKKTCGNYSHH